MSLQHFPPDPRTPGSGPIRLPAQCGTAAAPALHRTLIEAVAAGAPLAIDASEVESIGQAMLQLLLAARAAVPGTTIAPVSPAFAERVTALALQSALGMEP